MDYLGKIFSHAIQTIYREVKYCVLVHGPSATIDFLVREVPSEHLSKFLLIFTILEWEQGLPFEAQEDKSWQEELTWKHFIKNRR